VLFYFLVILFVVVGTLVILHSRGISLDTENLGFVRTGGIYISSQPNRASIFLDGEEYKNKSGVLQRGTLLTDLIPGTYQLLVNEEGFENWGKEVEVLPGEVSVFDTVILPANVDPEVIRSGQFSNFDIAPGYLALEGGGGVTLNDVQVFGHKIIELTENGSLLTQSENTGNYYLTNEFNAQNGLNLSLIFNNLKEDRLNLPGFVQLQEVTFLPDNERQFYVVTKNALYLLDTGKLNLELITTEYDNVEYQQDGTLVWTDNDLLYNFNPVLRNQAEPLDLAKLGLAGRSFTKILKVNGGWLFLDEIHELHHVSRESRLIARGVSDFWVAPNGNRLAVIGDESGLFVQDLDTSERFTGLGQQVGRLSWHKDMAHIVVLENEGVYFRDIGNGVPVNSYKLGDGASKFVYNAEENEVFFSNDSGVWKTSL